MIDDEAFYLEQYQARMQQDYEFYGATELEAGLELIQTHRPQLLLLDITFSPKNVEGLEWLPKIKKKFPDIKIIMVTGRDSLLDSRKARELGADDYFIKHEPHSRFKEVVENLLLPGAIIDSDIGLVAVSQHMREVLRLANRYAQSSSQILITGESGVGKEVVARYIHRHSPRHASSFVAVNSAAIEPNLIGSELFGHERGAFTGAVSRRIGKFEEAHGGTVFLDEIAEFRLQDQTKLLRAVENKTIQRLGSNKDIHLDVRIIAATNAPLEHRVEEGAFRKDLYYRLSVCQIHIPPLREREEDIIPLSQYFLQHAIEKNGSAKKTLTPGALMTLKNYQWSGNVRELKNVIEEAVVSSRAREISASQLKLSDIPIEKFDSFKPAKKEFERTYLKNALAHHRGNITATAKAIGISRQALQKKIAELGLDISQW